MIGVVIDLWETGDGRLFLDQPGREYVLAGLERTAGSTFTKDAAEIAAALPRWLAPGPDEIPQEGDPTAPESASMQYPAGWTVAMVPKSELSQPETRCVATWADGKVTGSEHLFQHGGQPGRAAREYLGLSEDEKLPRWEFGGEER